MKRVPFYFLALLFLLFGCVSAHRPVQRPEGPVTIAVWDFEDLSPSQSGRFSYFKKMLADIAIQKMQEMPGVMPVERSRLEQVLEEQALGSSELAQRSTRLRLGKLLGARWMMFGTYLVIGKQARIDMSLVDVETSKVLAAGERTIDRVGMDEAAEAVKSLVEKLLLQ